MLSFCHLVNPPICKGFIRVGKHISPRNKFNVDYFPFPILFGVMVIKTSRIESEDIGLPFSVLS